MKNDANFAGFLGETFRLLGDSSRAILIFILVLGGLNAAGLAFDLVKDTGSTFGYGLGLSINANSGPGEAAFGLVAATISIVGSYLLLAHMLSLRGLLRDRGTRIWAYIGMSILSVLGIVFGFVLLIFPGLIILTRWSASSGFLVGARAGPVEALSKSWTATRGYAWPIFFAGLVLFFIMAVLSGILGGATYFLSSEIAMAIVSSFADAAFSAVFMGLGIAVYTLLNTDEAQLEEVFA